MSTFLTVVLTVLVVLVIVLVLAVRIVKQYELGVLFRLGRVLGLREPGLRLIIPFVDVMHRVSLRIVTMPTRSQGIITRDNVSLDVSTVYLVQGESEAREWFDALDAPAKRWVELPRSGHRPQFEQPALFAAEMRSVLADTR